MDIELTVVMPSYNRGRYIKQAIESVLMQKTSFSYKLIIADDCSTDNTLEIAEEYQKNNPSKIDVLTSEKNQGLLPNCLRVYKTMRTKYFCVLDADDYWTDSLFLEKAYQFLEKNPEYTIYTSTPKLLIDGVVTDTLHNKNCKEEMTVTSIDDLQSGKGSYIGHTSATVFRNVIFSKGIPPLIESAVGTFSEASFRGDTDRYILHLRYGCAKFVKEAVSVYRLHETGIWTSASMFERHVMTARAWLDYCRFYEGYNKENFYNSCLLNIQKASAELLKMSFEKVWINNDAAIQNYWDIIKELQKEAVEEYTYDTDWLDVLENRESKTIFVWGTGMAARRLIDKFQLSDCVNYYVDSNPEKQGKYIKNIEILSPAQLKEMKQEKYVVIASSFYNSIIKQILDNDLCAENEIVNLYKIDRKYSLVFAE